MCSLTAIDVVARDSCIALKSASVSGLSVAGTVAVAVNDPSENKAVVINNLFMNLPSVTIGKISTLVVNYLLNIDILVFFMFNIIRTLKATIRIEYSFYFIHKFSVMNTTLKKRYLIP